MTKTFRSAALALAAAGLSIPALPAAAADFGQPGASRAVPVEAAWEHGRDRGKHKGWYRGRGNQDRYNRDYGRSYSNYGYAEPVYHDTRVWRGNDGRTYCRKRDGTTGLIVGAAAGAIVGREIDKHGDRSLGTILGAAAGAYLGKEVAQNRGSGCR